MASRHDIIHIDFEANAGKASPALNALRDAAMETRTQIERVKQELDSLRSSGAGSDVIAQKEKELKQLNRELKSFDQGAKDLVKGVERLDQGIKAFNDGTLSQMSAQFNKAVQNAAKLQKTKINPDTAQGKKGIEEMNALITATEKNVLKASQDLQQLTSTIAGGGHVSTAELREAKQTLVQLKDLAAEGSTEWHSYRSMLNTVEGALTKTAESERRMRGELVNANDARREALKLTKEGAEAAARERAAAEQAIMDSKGRVEVLQQQKRAKEEEAQATQRVIDKQTEEWINQKLVTEELEKQVSADKRKTDGLKKKAENLRKGADALAETAKKEADALDMEKKHTQELENEVQGLKNKLASLNETVKPKVDSSEIDALNAKQEAYNQKVQERIAAEQQLKEAQRKSIHDDPRIQQLNAEIAKLEELMAVSDKFRSKFAKMSDSSFEKGFMGEHKEKGSVFYAENYLERAYRDRLKASAADHPTVANDPEYQAAAKRVAGGIVQNAQENFRRAMFEEIKTGRLTSSDIEKNIEDYRIRLQNAAREAYGQPGGLTGDPEYNRYKFMIAQMEKYLEVAKQVEAEQRKIAGADPFLKATRSDLENGIYGHGFDEQISRRYFKQLGPSDDIRERQEKEREIASENLKKAKDEELQALDELNKAKKQSAEKSKEQADVESQLAEKTKELEGQQEKQEAQQKKSNKASEDAAKKAEDAAKAEQDYAKATDGAAKKLDEERAKLDAINERIDKNTEKRNKQLGEVNDYNQRIAEEGRITQEAEAKKKQAQEATEKSIEDTIALLKQENHDVIPANSEQWRKNQQEIERLQQTLRVMRGEVMSLSDAMKLSLTAGTSGFSGTAEDLRKAQQAIEHAIATTDKSSAKYDRLQKALARVKAEMSSAGMTSEKMQQVLANPKAVKSVDTLKSAVSRARAEMEVMGQRIERMQRLLQQAEDNGNTKWAERLKKAIKETSAQYEELAESTKKADHAQKSLANTSKGTASSFDKAWSRLKTYIGLYMGAAVAIQKLTGTLGDLMELSDKMGEVRKTTGFTAEEVGRLSENLKKLDVRTSLTSLMEVSAAAGQLGLKTLEDVQGFTEAANKLMIALPEMGKEAATEMMRVAIATGEVEKIRKQLQEGTIEGSSATAVAMEKIASTIDRLRATSASTAPEITDFVKRVGAVGAQSGITIDQVSALGSTVSSLGMRVEMSATALSRMIPAIKNNAFAIGKAIGVTQSWIDDQFKIGKGMDVILKIFEHIKQANMDADSIEAMFGSSMKDIMAELNQQGARAGIVFAGLAQGVDELKRQLGVAADAYEKNIAVQQEFEKMNETTAAKWERLKNQIEEFFVSDQTQRSLGWIIDRLREVVDLLVGNSGISIAIRTIITYLTALRVGIGSTFAGAVSASKNLFTAIGAGIHVLATGAGAAVNSLTGMTMSLRGVRAATVNARREWLKMEAAMRANIIGALVTAIGLLLLKLWQIQKAAKQTAAEIGRFNQKIGEERKALDDLFDPLSKSNTAQEERVRLISEINSKYSRYLGYMLSETSSAIQLADAHALIAKRIKEEAYERRIAEKEKKVREMFDEDINERYGNIVSRVRGGARPNADVEKIADDLKHFIDQNLNGVEMKKGGVLKLAPEFSDKLNGFLERLAADGKLYSGSVDDIRLSLLSYMVKAKEQHDEMMSQTANMRSDLRGIQGAIKTDLTNNLNTLISNVINFNRPQGTPSSLQRPAAGGIPSLFGGGQQPGGVWSPPWQQSYTPTQEQQMAPIGWKPQIDKKNVEQVRQFVADQDALRGALQASGQQIDDAQRRIAESWLLTDQQLKEYREILSKADRAPGGKNYNPYGQYNPMDPYEMWDADSLVARKKQMLEYVRALANGADVKAVLAKDEKFIDESAKKSIKNVRDAIEWYNTERLKIQDELASRHLTNEGGWANPAKAKGRKSKQVMSASALADLEEYYAWRKEEVERQRAEEGISEAEFNRRMEALEQEHLQKRSDLRKSFTSENKQEVETFRKWWASVKELDEQEWELIDAEWKVATQKERDINDMFAAKDLAAMRGIVVKQMKAIEEIIAKERPYDGITKNLEANLTTMGILFADIDRMKAEALKNGEDVSKIDALYGEERFGRIKEFLKQAENIYSMTFDQLAANLSEAGFGDLVDAIVSNENAEKMKQALMAQLRTVYDSVQDAIKKEASLIKKQVEIQWNDAMVPDGPSMKQAFESTISALGLQLDQVKRANSLIGAGQASERVADKLAIKQMEIRLQMQQTYFNMLKKVGEERIAQLKAAGKEEDAEHLRKSLNLSLSEEQKKLDEQRVAIANQLEESQNRLYTELKEWADLMADSIRSLFEASNTGKAEYYDELAKMRLTGEGSAGGTYVVIENSGTKDAEAHYEYLDGEAALLRQMEIERQNAIADARKKVMDDISQKMNDLITDQINAMLQNASVDANTKALGINTEALNGLSQAVAKGLNVNVTNTEGGGSGFTEFDEKNPDTWPRAMRKRAGLEVSSNPHDHTQDTKTTGGESTWLSPMGPPTVDTESYTDLWSSYSDSSTKATKTLVDNNKIAEKSTKSSFAAMTAAANMYGIAYQAMSNENLSTAQKVEMMIVQAAGQAMISMLTASLAADTAETASHAPSWISKTLKELGPIGGPVAVGVFTALIGGLMGLATSKITKSKSQIAAVTGAGSTGAGRLATGMLTYAEGNVNEFTDPSSLTPGRQYNVDAADGRTYRARYMGRNPRTHLTNGPEFHLVGEKGREAIIDAQTTRQITMDDNGIWRAIQTLYNGGSVSRRKTLRRGGGVQAFADGNLDDFDVAGGDTGAGMSMEQLAALQTSIDRQNDLLERALTNGIRGVFDVHGRNGLVNTYDTAKKEALRHGERYT